ncbi:hypothetical protein [Cytobacillus praedii]|uniref:hypothetical protein n=1 Tax=Cytobacillus praedii TaxID=1742358 RepID=UPI0007091AA4|nr:hypothetical protein [Cytobacillus praedii]
MEYLLFAIILLLIVFIYKREEQMKEERKDLMDRIMSKDFVEYKETTSDPVKYSPVTVTEEDEYWREVEDNKV